MFDGIMPPLAKAGKTVASGVQVVPTVAGLGFPSLGAAVGVCSARFAGKEPVILTIGGNPTGPSSDGQWPQGGGYMGGLINQASAAFGGPTSLRIACVLEYGLGSASNKVYMDWAPGSYNLPPCEYARVSALPWGTTWAGVTLNRFAAVASFSEGELQGAHVPVLSAQGALIAATAQVFTVPAAARAVEVFNTDTTTTPVITLKGAATATRNYATGLWIGPTPVPVNVQSGSLTVTSDVTTVADLRWYLSL